MDPDTDYRTCLNTLHAAIPYLLKSVKQVSELDLTTCLHVFPQKWQYAPKCTADGCNSGTLSGGGQCQVCKGTGRQVVIGTAQDHITLGIPDNPDEMFDLSKMSFYAQLPVELVNQMREIVEETRTNCIRAVYASDMYTKDQVNVTATAKAQELDSAYSALRPLIRKREEVKPYLVHVIAEYLDAGTNMTVTTILPQNLRYETAGDVVALMKESADVAGRSFMTSLSNDLIQRAYTDDPNALKKALVQETFNPFSGMAEGTILQLIAGGQVSKADEVMWTQMTGIFEQAEIDHKGEVPLYELAPDKLRAIIYAIRDERAGVMADQQPTDPAMLGTDPNGTMSLDPNADPNAAAVQDTALNGAQITSLLEVITLASTGAITKETARAIVDAAFPGINAQQVDAMFANMKEVDPATVKAAAAVADPGNAAGTKAKPEAKQPPIDKAA